MQTGKLGLDYGPDDCQADFNQINRARLGQGTSLDTEFKLPGGIGLGSNNKSDKVFEEFSRPRLPVNSKYDFKEKPQDQINIPNTSQSVQWELLRGFAELQNKNLERLGELFAAKQRKDNLPVEEPEVFSDDLLKYPLWKASFKALIESKTDDAVQRLYYLGKYTSGEAKAAISNLILLGPPEAYEKAQKILQERLGN